jgi:ferrochelatase
MIPPADHPPIPAPKIGVLLINLGTPNSPEPGIGEALPARIPVRSARREIPQLVWQPILRGIILNTRPKKSSHAYKQVWTEEGSPLAAITARQARRCRARGART